MCYTLTEYKKHCAILKENIIERGHGENILKDQIDKVDNIDQKDILSKKEKGNKDKIPCLITYNRKLPMMRKNHKQSLEFSSNKSELRETFQNNPFVAFKRNKNLQEIIGDHKIKNRKMFKSQPFQKPKRKM